MEEAKPLANAATPAHPEAQEPSPQTNERCGRAGAATVLRLILFLFIAFIFARTAYQARHRPGDLAFILSACYALALLLCCLKKFEQLGPGAAAEVERRRIMLAVWSLSVVLSFSFAWRLGRLMPLALGLVVWGLASVVNLAVFYFIVLRKLENCQDGGGANAFDETSPEEKV